jgi:hypothetical protein
MAAPVAGPVAQRIERPPPKGGRSTKIQRLRQKNAYQSKICWSFDFKSLRFFLASFWRAVIFNVVLILRA